MKKIKIKFIDVPGYLFQRNTFLEALNKKYDVEICDDPDYIIYSVFGTNHLKYPNCVKIFYTGECVTPNFNECDYGIGFDRLNFGDRYLRMPFFMFFRFRDSYERLKHRAQFTATDLEKKTEFCNYLVSNSYVKDKRTQIFLELNNYKKVNSGGRYMNNIGGLVDNKYEFQLKHKFSIAFENNSYDGYATEKLVDAFAANTIPIYWGDPRIAMDFNERAFVNCHRYNSLSEVVDVVKEIDKNDELYLQMMNEPVLKMEDAKFEEFLFNIFDQPLESAFRRPMSRWTIAIEERIKRHKFYEDNIYGYYDRFKHFIYRMKNDSINPFVKAKERF